jgi:AcrR family transcriptional regulator
MARIVKERAVRRTEILDAAQRLVYAKGYEQMTIQELLDALQISKGGFFHHFGSKAELLEALTQRWLDEAERLLGPIVDDPDLPTLSKLQRFFVTTARWKTGEKPLLLAFLRSWYSDSNALARQKLGAMRVERFAPLFTRIIRQGIGEGTLNTAHPERLGEVVLSLLESFGDAFARLLLAHEHHPDAEPRRAAFRRAEETVAVYTEALERVLRAPRGSLRLIDADSLNAWFVSPPATGPDRAPPSSNEPPRLE